MVINIKDKSQFVNGYLRPTSNYNDAKKAEFADRKTFKLYYETEESHI